MFSPSNSGTLRQIGDVVTLNRDPRQEIIGVQTHGDAEGAELVFEGNTAPGGPMLPLDADSSPDPLPPQPNGRFLHMIAAQGVHKVQARLVNIAHGFIHVALYSGSKDMMNAPAAMPAADVKPLKPVKITRAAASNAGPQFRVVSSQGKFFVFDDSSGRTSPAQNSEADCLAWMAQQTAAQKKQQTKQPPQQPPPKPDDK
jgi:hypothetical protein